MNASPVVGVDIGSVSVSMVCLSGSGKIEYTDYRFHRGRVGETLSAVLGLAPRSEAAIACTSTTPHIIRRASHHDSQVCFIEASRRMHGRARSLLVVGAENFALFRFDAGGRFLDLRASTSCAAGTGSFLDQQARRLGFSGSAELASLAAANRKEAAPIASRCAVFAKTDLCHAQAAGYGLEQICDGLCLGLARNIADTVSAGEKLLRPAVLAGGVSRNPAVVSHLQRLLGCRFAVGELSHLYGALGAALCALRGGGAATVCLDAPGELIEPGGGRRSYYYEPLRLELSTYPNFHDGEAMLFSPSVRGFDIPVEIDLYAGASAGGASEAILGIDIGSTSTKAVLIDQRRVLAGFYTRTAGRPLEATQAILEALDNIPGAEGAPPIVRGVGTTGSGRKFIGEVIGADLILNEITAHARAACELDPTIDTIIEIGGQDSKFTTLRDGLVTFSQMNTVCAAGTGSFIEEQAERLGVALEDYSRRAEGARAPLASDRCTVFMERDINHYLNKKYSVEEILAAVLFSVRENYLLKVSSEALIGERVCFQGATAKNRALVAAFEQKLKRPIFVSRYCHLTGALGVALALRENPPARTRFRGIGLYRECIPVRSETCRLCANLCRLRIAEVRGQTVAYGFLCGRDYEVKRFVSSNRSGFDMRGEYRRAFEAAWTGAACPPGGAGRPAGARFPAAASRPPRASAADGLRAGSPAGGRPTVGIPAALHLLEELPLWKRFFAELGVTAVTSEGYRRCLKEGKRLTRAEFCAPITMLHGHACRLAESCDALFLPVYLEAPSEQRRRGRLRHYCYYTQYAPSLISLLEEGGLRGKILLPLVDHGSLEAFPPPAVRRLRSRTGRELFRALSHLPGLRLSFDQVSRAYERALTAYRTGREKLPQVYAGGRGRNGDIEVVLAGRPYLVLEPEMNKGIPDIFASLGVRTYYQDMLPPLRWKGGAFRFSREGGAAAGQGRAGAAAGEIRRILDEVKPLLEAVHWDHAARILEAAAFCAATEGLYPVLITAFKCSPDSFVIEYFKRLLDAHHKPYLVLQIDEHDSSVGYETRIEAGLHSFRNHAARAREAAVTASSAGSRRPKHQAAAGRSWIPRPAGRIRGKTLLFPNWDSLTIPLVVANLRRGGVDARPLEEDELSIRSGTRLNTGQCLPANAIAQSMVSTIERHGLDPARTLLWMAKSVWSCNIPLFPHYIKSLLQSYGGGMEKAEVFVGDLSHSEISPFLGVGAYFAYLFGGLLRRLGCRIRPYEVNPGQTDRTIAAILPILVDSFLGLRSKQEALAEMIGMFEAIPVRPEERPKVAVFGDLYVRDNDVMNQDLIHFIERAGAEVVTTPYSEYLRIVADATFKSWKREGHTFVLAKFSALLALVNRLERSFFPLCRDYIDPPESFRNPEPERKLSRFNVRLEHHGESWDNLLKIAHLTKRHPGLKLFVQTNPAFCCPSLVTEAMAGRIQEITGVPVVTLTYDGTGSFKNERIVPYLVGLGRHMSRYGV